MPVPGLVPGVTLAPDNQRIYGTGGIEAVLRVVLAEDNLLVRAGTKQLLQSTGEIEVVGEASNAVEAEQLVRDLRPDAVITDIRMPPSFRLEGIELALQIRAKTPETGVVVLSSHDDPEYAHALFNDSSAGLAYLLKERVADPDELIRAVREVARGGTVMDPKIVEIIVSREATSSDKDISADDRKLLDLMARGASYAEMAAQLDTTETDVDKQVSDVLGHLADAAGRGVQVAVSELRRLHMSVVEKEASTAALSRFLSPQVARGVLSKELLEPSELELTVIFTDVRGFTRLTESTDPQVMRELLDEHLTAMSEIVLARDGMVDKFIGDAVMAVFGAPVRTADHAARALGCAEAMLFKQDELNARWTAGGRPPFAVGIGVNTGTATAGSVGGAKLEYTVVGDAVNVAQRLNSLAAGGEIVASEATATAAGVVGREIETHNVKGREQEVRIVRLRPAASERTES